MNYHTPKEIAYLTSESGEKKANQGVLELLISAFLAGAYIAIAAEVSTVVGHDVAKYLGYGLAKFVIGSVFSLGLLLVVICGANLFTGNTLLVMAYLNKKIGLQKIFRNWGLVFLGNFIGALTIALIIYKTNLWQANQNLVGVSIIQTAYAKVNLSFSEAFFRGVMCNWLVCLGIWAMTAAKDIAGKVAVCYFIIMAFVASGFEHVVANMYYIPIGLLLKGHAQIVQLAGFEGTLESFNFWNMLNKNIIPVSLGNIVGGAFFVGTLYWILFLRPEKEEILENKIKIKSAAR